MDLLNFSEVVFENLEIEHLNGVIVIDMISYSRILHEITVKHKGNDCVLKVNSSRQLGKKLIDSLFVEEFLWDQNNISFAIGQLIQYITEYMTEDDKRIVNDGEALLSCFMSDYKKTRNYTLLVEDHKLSDDEIFSGLLLGAGRADVYSAWELYFKTKKFTFGS